MNYKFVQNFGVFLVIFAFIISGLTFYFWDSFEAVFVGIVSIISGILFYVFYSKVKKVNKLIISSVITSVIATSVAIFFSITTFISLFKGLYGVEILFGMGLMFSGIIYGISLVLLIINWLLNRNKN